MRPYLRLIQTEADRPCDTFRLRERRQAALVEAAISQYVECVLGEVARTGRASDTIGALILVETALQQLDRLFRPFDLESREAPDIPR